MGCGEVVGENARGNKGEDVKVKCVFGRAARRFYLLSSVLAAVLCLFRSGTLRRAPVEPVTGCRRAEGRRAGEPGGLS